MVTIERLSGVLMPLSALPSPHGIGTLGKCAYDFVDFLSASGQSYWQLLPLGPTSYGDSPYSSFSTFAGNPYYIDLDVLAEDGLLSSADIATVNWGEDLERVDYGRIYSERFKILRKAYVVGKRLFAEEAAEFRRENSRWIESYALYMAVKAHFGMKSWLKWPDEDIRMHSAEAVERYSRLLRDDVDFYAFLQYLFYKQWTALRAYAADMGIKFIGDVPIYVALDSADVWSEPQFFCLDDERLPTAVAGVPPDIFSETGQLWGNPLYDWDAMRADGFGWWIRRIDGSRKLYDIIRIDHFRGFEDYWAVPYGEETAIEGEWLPGPGMELVGVLTSWFYELRFIAEDLGIITDGVRELLTKSALPGMKVLQFAFDPESDSDYLPHNCLQNSVCYVGTHDNDTVLGWLDEASEDEREFARSYMNISEDEGWCWGFIRTGMATPCMLFVASMQDLLELPGTCRMNTPGTTYDNWQWRMLPDAADEKLASKLLTYTTRYRRLPKVEDAEEIEEE